MIKVNLRERCSIEAFQLWLDSKEPGHKVVGVKAEAPCNITLEVEEAVQRVLPFTGVGG